MKHSPRAFIVCTSANRLAHPPKKNHVLWANGNTCFAHAPFVCARLQTSRNTTRERKRERERMHGLSVKELFSNSSATHHFTSLTLQLHSDFRSKRTCTRHIRLSHFTRIFESNVSLFESRCEIRLENILWIKNLKK